MGYTIRKQYTFLRDPSKEILFRLEVVLRIMTTDISLPPDMYNTRHNYATLRGEHAAQSDSSYSTTIHLLCEAELFPLESQKQQDFMCC